MIVYIVEKRTKNLKMGTRCEKTISGVFTTRYGAYKFMSECTGKTFEDIVKSTTFNDNGHLEERYHENVSIYDKSSYVLTYYRLIKTETKDHMYTKSSDFKTLTEEEYAEVLQ